MQTVETMGYYNLPGRLTAAQAARLLREHGVPVYEASDKQIVCSAMLAFADDRHTFKPAGGGYSARKLADWLGY